MNRSLNAIANRIVFATSKNRVDIRKAKTNDHALHAYAVHAIYGLYGALRGLLGAGTQKRASTTARPTECSTQLWCSWMSGMQPCRVVRRRSPAVVVVA